MAGPDWFNSGSHRRVRVVPATTPERGNTHADVPSTLFLLPPTFFGRLTHAQFCFTCCFNDCSNTAKEGQRFCGAHDGGRAAATASPSECVPSSAVASSTSPPRSATASTSLPSLATVPPTDALGRRIVCANDLNVPAPSAISVNGADGQFVVTGLATIRCYSAHDPALLAERAELLEAQRRLLEENAEPPPAAGK